MLDDRDVVRFLVLHQPAQVRPDRVEGIEGHHGAGQVHWLQQLGEVAGLVVLDADLEMVQEVAAMLGDAEQVDPGPIGAAGSPGGLAVHGHGPHPAAGQHPGLPGSPPTTVAAYAGRGRAAAPAPARAAGEQGPGQGPGVKTVQDHPDRLLIRCPVPAGDRVPRSAQPGQVRLAGPSDPLPDRGEPVVPGSGERAHGDRDQAGQRIDPSLRRARVRQRFRALPRIRDQILAVGTGLDHAHPRATLSLRAHHTSSM